MVVDAVRAYFEAVNGLTELTRKRAVAAAKVILKASEERPAAAPGSARPAGPAGAAGESGDGAQRSGSGIQTLAGELIETSQANREALNGLIGSEVERALQRLELVSRADYDRLARRVAELERRLAAQRPLVGTAPVHAAVQPVDAAPAEASEPEPVRSEDGGPAAAADRTGKPASEAPAAEASAPEAPAAETPAESEGEADAAGERRKQPVRAHDGADGAQAGDAADAAESASAAETADGESPGEAAEGGGRRSDSATPGGGAVNGQAAKKPAASAKGQQQRSTKPKSGSGRSGTGAKNGGAKRTASRGKNSTKNDQ